jgi:hypothetical protein
MSIKRQCIAFMVEHLPEQESHLQLKKEAILAMKAAIDPGSFIKHTLSS